MNRNSLLSLACATTALSMLGAVASAGTFKTITVDGNFSDWTGVPVLATDPSGDGNPIDLATVQIANDATNLYLRVTFATPVNPNIGPSNYVSFDTDNNVSTGFDIYGLHFVGAEVSFANDFPFVNGTNVYNTGDTLSSAAAISPVDFADPSDQFTSQEYSIPRNLTYTSGPKNGQAVFGNSFTMMFWTDSGTQADTTVGIPYIFGALTTGWSNSGSGDYNVASNWSSNSVPNSVDAVAEFSNAITSAQTVYSNTAVTVGTLSFNNPNTYVLAGAGSMTLDVSSGTASINVLQGSQKINLPLRLNDSTVATVAAGATLTIADPLTLANGSTLTKAGAGTLEIISTTTTVGGSAALVTAAGTTNLRMNVGAGTALRSTGGVTRAFTTERVSSVQIDGGTIAIDSAGPVHVLDTDSLTIAGGATPAGKLDLGDNGAIVRYTAGSPAATIRALIQSGRSGGNGITTSAATSGPNRAIGYAESNQVGSPSSFLGQAFSGSAVLLRYTLTGDANLDGSVSFADLVSLAQNYNGTGKVWVQGDSNYDGAVNFADLVALAQNYNGTLSASQSAAVGSSFAADFALAQSFVPEPTSLALLGLGAIVLRRKDRRANA